MEKNIVVNAAAEEAKVAILGDGKLKEFYVERAMASRLVGSIYKGKVEAVLSGIGAAFVNIGLEKNGFLYVDDIIEEGLTYSDIVEEEMGQSFQKKEKIEPKKINEIINKGQELLVQVVKEPIGTKGVRLTAHITLPGKFLVFMAHDRHRGISRKIIDQKERKRLKSILGQLGLPDNAGIIIRTAAVGHNQNELRKEAINLYNLYRRIERIASKKSAPSLIHQEYSLVQRIARDNLTEDVSSMVIDSKLEYKKTLALLRVISPHMRPRLKLYKGQIPIFERFGIAGDIAKIYERKVQLPCGGYIVIEPAEGLVTVDVNTGGFSGRDLEQTSFVANKEAAVEIARQLRLRDIGGIIVIDFIDMEDKGHRNAVFQTLLDALKDDKSKTKVLNFSSIGLVEMTRQRMRKSLESASYQNCPYCSGRGVVKSTLTMAIEVVRLLEKRLKGERYRTVEIVVNPNLREFLLKNYKGTLTLIGKRSKSNIIVQGEPQLHIEEIKLNLK